MQEIASHYEQCVQEESMKCPWCPKTFSGSSGGTLDQHRKTKHFWGVFRCLTCRFKAHFAKDLIEHIQSEGHTEDAHVHCPQCKTKINMENIQSHYEDCVSNVFTKCK